MQAFKGKRLGVSTAYELSGLSPDYQQRAADTLEEVGVLSINDAKELKEEAAKPLAGQMGMEGTVEAAQDVPDAAGNKDTTQATEAPQGAAERPQDTPDEEVGTDTTTAKDGQQDAPQEPQKGPEKTRYVEREVRGRGCAFCNSDYHREQSTAEGTYLLAYEPEEKTVLVMDKETGTVEHIIFHCCPFCGRKLK